MRRFGLRFVLVLFSKCVATWYLRGRNGRGNFGVHLSPKKMSFVYIEIQKFKNQNILLNDKQNIY